jgi:hypothetical protein
VREGKVLKFLETVVFKIRKPLTKAQIKEIERKRKGEDPIIWEEPVITQDDLEWAKSRAIPEDQYRQLREGDLFNPETDSVVVPDILVDDQGDLLKFHSIYTSYVSALAELYQTQVSLGVNTHPSFRGQGFKNWMETQERKQDSLAREQYADRGAGGINATYTDEEFLRCQVELLKSAGEKHTVS